jgi:hypothetical protein
MRNRALTGPEKARQYPAYISARDAAIAALTPFYRNEFGRTAAEAQRFAALYLDRKISDGFETDPDDPSTLMLLAPDYAEKHDIQQAALAGDTLALRDLLGPEPKAIAKGVTRDLDEPLVTDTINIRRRCAPSLELGLDPNEIGASGRTALMTAARLDLVEAADILMAHGAAPDTGAGDAVAQTDSTGDPLCMKGDVAVSDAPGRTALSYAAELGSPEMVRLLLDRGASAARVDGAAAARRLRWGAAATPARPLNSEMLNSPEADGTEVMYGRHASIPIRAAGSLAKNATTCPRRSRF